MAASLYELQVPMGIRGLAHQSLALPLVVQYGVRPSANMHHFKVSAAVQWTEKLVAMHGFKGQSLKSCPQAKLLQQPQGGKGGEGGHLQP